MFILELVIRDCSIYQSKHFSSNANVQYLPQYFFLQKDKIVGEIKNIYGLLYAWLLHGCAFYLCVKNFSSNL